jgi:hypothetical protein
MARSFIDHHPHDWMLCQPALFALGQLQFLIGEQQVAAGTPAFGDVFPLADRDRFKDGIDDIQQLWIVLRTAKLKPWASCLPKLAMRILLR